MIESIKKQQPLRALPAHQSELFWWVEIKTSVLLCTYYFDPFDSRKEARDSRTGYVEDLDRGHVIHFMHCRMPDGVTEG